MSKQSSAWRPGVPLPRPEGARATEPDVLDNPAAGRVARVAGLQRRAARTRHSQFLVEGPQGVREVVRCAAQHVRDLYVTDAAAARHPQIVHAAREAGLYVHRVTHQVMEAMSGDAQGLLAVVDRAALPTPEAVGEALEGARLVVVLTESQDPGNTGTIIRAADAAGADAVILLRGSVEVTNPKVVRSTAGSIFHLPVLSGLGLDDVARLCRERGLGLVAADGGAPTSLFSPEAEALLSAPTAWLMGNEARGFTPQVLAQADHVVSIPLLGQAESLNVASAAAVCLYTSARLQRAAG